MTIQSLSVNLFHVLLVLTFIAGGCWMALFIRYAMLREAEPQFRRRAARLMWAAAIVMILLICPGTFIVAAIQLYLTRYGIFFGQ